MFPVAVAVICVVLALVHAALPAGRERPPRPARWPARLVTGYALAAGCWVAAGHLLPGAPAALFAPPVFVSGLEWAAAAHRTPAGGGAQVAAAERRRLRRRGRGAAGRNAAALGRRRGSGHRRGAGGPAAA